MLDRLLAVAPAPSGETLTGSARRNEVGKVVARSRIFEGRDTGVWYKVEIEPSGGWLHESSLNVYRSEAEARKAAESGS